MFINVNTIKVAYLHVVSVTRQHCLQSNHIVPWFYHYNACFVVLSWMWFTMPHSIHFYQLTQSYLCHKTSPKTNHISHDALFHQITQEYKKQTAPTTNIMLKNKRHKLPTLETH